MLVKYPQTIASVTEGQEAVFYDGDKCIGGVSLKKSSRMARI